MPWFPYTSKRLDPASEQVLLGAGFVLPDGKRAPPRADRPEQALRNSAVYSCIKLSSEAIASLPARLIDRETKREVTDHNVSRLLREPNPEQTSVEFWEMVLANYMTWGVGFVEVLRSGGRPVELLPFASGCVETKRNIKGDLVHLYTAPGTGQRVEIPNANVMAFRMFGLNYHFKQFAPIWIAQRAIELALTQEQTAIENFSDGLRPDVIIKLPPEKALEKLNDLGPQFMKEESQKIQNQIAGARTRRELYLPFGYDSTPYSANFQQAQFRETRDFQILEFARIWNIPPSKLGVIAKQPNASAEQDDLRFYKDMLRPVVTKIEKRLERDLLSPKEREQLQVKFNIRALLRGDIKTQTEQYTRLWQIGVYNRNEIRDSEDLTPIEGGDEYQIPVNMTTEQIGGADQGGTNEEARALPVAPERRTSKALTEAQQRSIKGRKAAAEGVKVAFAEAIVKVVRAEKAQVMSDVKRLLTNRTAQDLRERLSARYSEGGDLYLLVNQNVRSPIRRLFDAIVAELRRELPDAAFSDDELETIVLEYQRIYVRDYTRSSLLQLLQQMRESESESEMEQRIETRLDEWENGTSEETPSRAEKESTQETRKGNAVFSKGLYALSGVTLLSVVNSSPCELCDPIVGTYSIGNAPIPPFHRGCECDVVSG